MRRERKVVSVLFCDLVGFTAASETADPEDVDVALADYHRTVRGEIERFGGTVEKFIGDAVVAVFGAPVAHEDDAERAVRSGLRILSACDLELRIAVHTGEVLVRLDASAERGEAMVAGDVVNTASRLQGVAPSRRLIVGQTTFQATRDTIEYVPMTPMALRGKRAQVAVWRAVGVRHNAHWGGVAATPFVGRESELALLGGTFERARNDKNVQLVTIMGEPGVGKSRLLREFRDAVEPTASWLQGRCPPYGEGIAFWALGEVVKSHCGILETDSVDAAKDKLAASMGDMPERQWLQARLAPLVGLQTAGQSERGESFAAWRRYLEELAARSPLVVAIEDLHWADAAMLEFTNHLADEGGQVPMLVVCTARPELYEVASGWGGGKRNASTIGLSPLADSQAERLIDALAAAAELEPDVWPLVVRRAEGNPLYAEELVRMLRESDGEAVGELPATLQTLIAARVDALSASRKAVVHCAAVVGTVFWTGAVAACGDQDEATVGDALQELGRRELVRPRRHTSVEGQPEWTFWHSVVRDVAYGQITRPDRIAKHRAVARWIESVAGNRLADHADVLAHHYTLALELSAASGEPRGDLLTQARRFAEMAASRAERLDPGAAVALFRRAIDLYPPGVPGRARAEAGLAWALHTGGAPFDEVEELLDQAIADAEATDDRVALGRALSMRSVVCFRRGEIDRGSVLGLRAVAVLETEPPGEDLVAALGQAAWNQMAEEHPAESVALADRAIALATELGLPAASVTALVARASSRSEHLGDPRPAGYDRAAEVAETAGLGFGLAMVLGNLADHTWRWDGAESGRQAKQRSIDVARRRGLRGHLAWLEGEMVWPDFDSGAWDDVLDAAAAAERWEERHGTSQIGVITAAHAAYVHALRGNLDHAEAIRDGYIGRAREIPDTQSLAPALSVAALIERTRGRPDEAVALIAEMGDIAFHAWAPIAEVCRTLVLCGALERLAEALEREWPEATRIGNGVAHGRAALAEATAGPTAAVPLYTDAAARWEAFGHVYEHGQALLGLGRCLQASGQADPARVHLVAAKRIFSQLGALSADAECSGVLG